jgi:hypothetical protein
MLLTNQKKYKLLINLYKKQGNHSSFFSVAKISKKLIAIFNTNKI